MSLSGFIARRLQLTLFFILFVGLTVFLKFGESAGSWADSSALRAMPYLVIFLAMVLGACFHQTKVSFIAFFQIVAMALLSNSAFTVPDDRRLYTIVLMSSVYLPVLAVVFYHMKEQGVLSAYGYLKMAIILSALIAILLVPKIPSLTDSFTSAQRSFFVAPMSSWIEIPWIGIIVLLFSLAFLSIPKAHESPSSGMMIGLSVMYMFMGMNFRSSMWPAASAETGFVLMNSGAGIVMISLVLESAWRHANIDELTQLPGRRALKLRLDRLGGGYGLALLDIDFFKKINDKYGHDTGDQVLKFIASQMRKSEAGLAYRYGGEEFVIVCTRCERQAFGDALDDLREAIASRPFGIRGLDRPKKKSRSGSDRGGGAEKIKVTVSIGAALHDRSKYDQPSAVLEAADKALYKSKRTGRNKVTLAR